MRIPSAALPLLLAAAVPASLHAQNVVGQTGGALVGEQGGARLNTTHMLNAAGAVETKVPGKFDAAYEAVLAVYDELKLKVNVQNPAAGTVGISKGTYVRKLGGESAGRALDCGIGPDGQQANSARLAVSMSTTVQTVGDEALLVTTLGAEGVSVAGASNTRFTCASTGVLEKKVHTMVAQRLAALALQR